MAGLFEPGPGAAVERRWQRAFLLRRTQSVVGVSVQEAGGALQFGSPHTIVSQWTILTIPFFSVSPDGKRFLMERVSQQVNQPITLITNFTSALKK